MNNRIQRKNPFWSLAGPLLGFLAIQGGVQFLIQLGMEMPYMMRAYDGLMRKAENGIVPSVREIGEVYVQALEPALKLIAAHRIEIAAVSALATVILTGILFARDRRLERQCGIALPQKASISKYWTLLVFGIAGSIAATCLMTMVQLAFYDAGYQQTAEVMYSAGLPVQIVGLGIVIPVSEELMFRGILYKRLRERQTFWYAAVWSAVLFAFMHSNTTQVIYAFLLGVMLSFAYEKFGSFKAPVLLHVLMNTASVILTETGVFGWMAADPIRMAGAVIAGAFICSVMFVLIQRMEGGILSDSSRKDDGSSDMF
nr:CPBP family intramembrane glutamic endopeptidase [uncultured Mediterraneibacter sp.]